MEAEEIKEAKRIVNHLKIQVDKLIVKIDAADNMVQENYREIDAIKFDVEMLEKRLESYLY